MKYTFLVLFGALVASCTGEKSPSDKDLDIEQEFEELSDELLGDDTDNPVWTMRSDSAFFEMEVPTQMEPNERLNPIAKLKYGYVGKFEGEVKEHFVIVLVEELPDDVEGKDVDIVGFTEAYIDSLMDSKESYEILNEPALESINEMDAIVHELRASLIGTNDSLVDIYYMLGVYLGERAIYQVLTWTLMDQKDDFRSDMRRMIYSFSELKEEEEFD
ncbi:MAG: hypothetical protein HUJ25_10060 [Crocinitomicaceae bacterium]|nr:hypothetical protein [Crocinitomicaceae bacterium]